MRVVCILGKGRSGSTLLDMLLGSQPGFVSAGELWHRRGHPSLEQLMCSCLRPTTECPVWGQVLRHISRQYGATGFSDLEELEKRVHAWTNVPGLLRAESARGRTDWSRLAGYIETTYQSLVDATGASIVVDSSKWPFHMAALGLVDGLECFVVHLVRDPRGVAFSWSKGAKAAGGLPKYGPMHSALSWIARNLGAERVKVRHEHATIRYEDLALNPNEALMPVMEWVGLEDLNMDNLASAPPHILAGNPMKVAPKAIRIDSEWTSVMARRDRIITWTMTAPLARRYGYHWKT